MHITNYLLYYNNTYFIDTCTIHTAADCPYQYLVVPQPEYNCNPIGQAAVRVP